MMMEHREMDSGDESNSREDFSNAGEDVDVYLNHYRIPKLSNLDQDGINNGTLKSRGNRDQIKYNSEGKLLPLTELAAQKVACHLPFGQVEHFTPPVPEPMQCRIAFWSFPQDEEDIRLYTCLANGNADVFMRAEDLIERNSVRNMLQVGFHLSANVQFLNEAKEYGSFGVALTFDRRRITSCSCSCISSTIWCQHAVAVCLQRIRRPHLVTLRAPVSESLQRLEKNQLQKFAQYLINELPQQILPAAQMLLDELLSGEEASINKNPAAPDPTAGATVNEVTSWCLDYEHLSMDIRRLLLRQCSSLPTVCDVNTLHAAPPPAAAEYTALLRQIRGREPEGLWNLFSIVGEMMKRRDSNYFSLLEILMQQTLESDKIITWWFETKVSLHSGSTIHLSNTKSTQNTSQYSCSNFCDEIVHLWRLAAMNPSATATERKRLYEKFFNWHLAILKRFSSYDESHPPAKTSKRNILELFPGLKPAMEGSLIDWSDWDDKSGKIVTVDNSKNEDGKTAKQLKKKRRKLKAKHAAISASTTTAPVASEEPEASTSKTAEDSQELATPQGVGEPEKGLEVQALPEVLFAAEPDGSQRQDADEILNEPQIINELREMNLNEPDVAVANDVDPDLQVYYMNRPDDGAPEEQKPVTIEDLIKINTKRVADPLETLYAKTEGLYYHGYIEEARKLARKVANEILNLRIYPSVKQVFNLPRRRKKRGTLDNQLSIVTSEALAKMTFICNVLIDCKENHNLIFRLIMLGVNIKRSPAATKPLEVKLINQKQELLMILKHIALHQHEMDVLRGIAQSIIDSSYAKDIDPLTTLLLGSFLFKALTLSKTPTCSSRSRTPSGHSSHHGNQRHTSGSQSGADTNHNNNNASRQLDSVTAYDKLPSDIDLGLQAALHAISVKVNVLEADHPLLCEGIRRQRGELAISLLTYYKDDQEKLDLILKHLLDKDVVASLPSVASQEKPSDKALQPKKTATTQDPDSPTEASAYFMFELAKTVFDKAGGNSLTVHLFRPQLVAQNGSRDIHRNLHMCVLRIALYSLRLVNLANISSQPWMDRTFSSTASFIHDQALEIGLPAVKYLRDNWDGSLTPKEAVSIADKAGCSNDPEIKQIAAEMAKSCLKYAKYLELNAVTRIFNQCKDQAVEMIESACNEIERVAEHDNVCADVLFATAKAWFDLYARTLDRYYTEPNVFQLNVPEQDTGASNWSTPQSTPANWGFHIAPQYNEPQIIQPAQWNGNVYGVGWHNVPPTAESPIYPNIDYLKAAYRVGIKAMDALNSSAKSSSKKDEEILWLLELSKFLGRDCLHTFSQSAIRNIHDPRLFEFIIQYMDLPPGSIDWINILLPVVYKCLEKCVKQLRDSLRPNSQSSRNEIESIIDLGEKMTRIANTPSAVNQFEDLLKVVETRKTKRHNFRIDTTRRRMEVNQILNTLAPCNCDGCQGRVNNPHAQPQPQPQQLLKSE